MAPRVERLQSTLDLPGEAKLRRLRYAAQRLVDSLMAGNYRSVFRGQGIEFDEVREYVDGDDARLIDWNVSSRLGSVYTKTFREEREMSLFLVVDTSASLAYGSAGRSLRDVAVIVCALFALAAVRNNDKVGAVLFSDDIDAWIGVGKGRSHIMRLLHEVVGRPADGLGSDIARALRVVGESLTRRGIVVIVSDFHATGYQRELATLSKRHDVIAVRVSDPSTESLPAFPLLSIRDPETGKTTYLNGRSRRFRFGFEQYWRRLRRQWLRECARYRISPIEVATVDEVAERLIQFLSHKATRR